MPNLHRERTVQKEFYEQPSHVEFYNDSERILKSTLLAVEPEEGCALLIGSSIKLKNQAKANILQIKLIWPCCNVWTDPNADLKSQNFLTSNKQTELMSRKNRFKFDPREQLFAQKWSREKSTQIIGTAHSHINAKAIPSEIDMNNYLCPNLMIIVNNYNDMKAWWINTKNICKPIELACKSKNQINLI